MTATKRAPQRRRCPSPSYNGKRDAENPLTVQSAFDKLDYFYTKPEKGSFAVFDKTVTTSALYSGADLYYHDPEKENPWKFWESPTPLQNSKITAHPVEVGNGYPDASGNTHGWIFFFDKVVKPYIQQEKDRQEQNSNGG